MQILVFYIILAIGISFICSILEAAMLSITPSYLQSLKVLNPKKYERLSPLCNNIERPLASILTWNTIAHTVGATGAGAEALKFFGNEWISLFSVVLTLAILFLSEIIPKSLGTQHWKFFLNGVVVILPPMIFMTLPFVFISEKIYVLFKYKKKDKISRDEVCAIAEIGLNDGVLEEEEYNFVKKMMDFRNVIAGDIVKEKKEVVGLMLSMSFSQAVDQCLKTNFARLPIFGIDRNDIKGYVLKNELIKVFAQKDKKEVIHFLRPILIVPNYVKLNKIFVRLLERKEHIVAVVDDFGDFIGIVTLEDIIDSLLGLNIIDELDET